MMQIRELPGSTGGLEILVRKFLERLQQLNGQTSQVQQTAVEEEARGYFGRDRNVYGIWDVERLIGFAVLKTVEDVCWLDWIFVDEDFRGSGAASELFDYTETRALERGSDQLYIWVHPDNDAMLRFLRKKGYNVLNLIELKKKKDGIKATIKILDNEVKY